MFFDRVFSEPGVKLGKMNQPSRLEKIDQQISTAQFLMKLFKK